MGITEGRAAGEPLGSVRQSERKKLLPILIISVVALSLLYLFHYFAPLEIASVTFYAGVTISIVGVLCLIKPIWWLGIRKRKVAALVILLGVALLPAGLFWPAGSRRIAARESRLDDFMPDYHFSERHEVRVRANTAKVKAAIEKVTFDELRVYHALMRVRGLAAGRNVKTNAIGQKRVLEVLLNPASGFIKLDEDSQEIVFGMAGRPWAAGRPLRWESKEAFQAFNAPHSVKIVCNLRVEDEGGGWSRIVTETRIRATDDSARRTMGMYWRMVYPGSGMIRRNWLNAIRDRAESPGI
ncbi:MAG: hypothetical protein EHM61_13175 [Acidobacteria bacterium]|nr:MAG: hypothetical protein EHM61_13175 [Acidobacteriota bacterium]